MSIVDQFQGEVVTTHITTSAGSDIELAHVPKIGIHLDDTLVCEYKPELHTGQLVSYLAIKHAGENIDLADIPRNYRKSQVYTKVVDQYNGRLDRLVGYSPFELQFYEEKGRKRLSGFVLRQSKDTVGTEVDSANLDELQNPPGGRDPRLLFLGKPTKDENRRIAGYIQHLEPGQIITVREVEVWAAENCVNGRSASMILEALCGVDVKKEFTAVNSSEADATAVFYTKL